MTFYMKQSDQVDTRWRAGIPVDTASELLFLAARQKNSPADIEKVVGADPADPNVVVAPITSAESADIGTLYVEVQATYPDGQVITLPANGYERLVIIPDLNIGPS
jgi:hypothetical protein